ncbi:hypothetical protein [Streptomyces lutosisoli]|uniref:Uncharacterized protein n=1 Tax=Streptomyces lutosisoli TaxID=2665721 RepID=A0ABW2VYU0_9ACTN
MDSSGTTTCWTAPGPKRIVHAGYTASGRSLDFLGDFIREQVLPRYGNTHTESSSTGLQTTRLREDARRITRTLRGEACSVRTAMAVPSRQATIPTQLTVATRRYAWWRGLPAPTSWPRVPAHWRSGPATPERGHSGTGRPALSRHGRRYHSLDVNG